MLKIYGNEFQIKFTEISLRQRMFEGDSYITFMINTEFYPTLVDDQVVSGTVLAKVDMKDIHCLDDLVGRKLKGDIGKVSVSVSNDGVWESQDYDNFQVHFLKRNGRELEFVLQTKDLILDTKGVITFLYSINALELKKQFDLKNFYEKGVEKSIHDHVIVKYFAKDERER